MHICSAWDDTAKVSLQMSITMAVEHAEHQPMNWSGVSSCQWLTDVQTALSVVLLLLNLRHMSSPHVLITRSSPSASQLASLATCHPLWVRRRITAALTAPVVVIAMFELFIIALGFWWLAYFLAPTSFFLHSYAASDPHKSKERKENRGIQTGKKMG